ncbi:MAG: CDP-alcohol phosphatidyltransferase family protein [Pyrinomonadaceae bacterium]
MEEPYSFTERFAAWGVHLFSICGLLVGFLAILAIGVKDFRTAFGWLIVAQFIDGVDGTLARRFHITRILPQINGKTIDYVIDFSTYAVIPTYFIYSGVLLPDGAKLPLSFLILLVSAIYYGKEGMVSDDNYFVGFPVMWNMVAFYLYFVLNAAPAVNALIIIICAVLHFVPLKFAYPSRARKTRIPTITITVVLLLLMSLIVWYFPKEILVLRLGALLSLSYFAILAIIDTFRLTK